MTITRYARPRITAVIFLAQSLFSAAVIAAFTVTPIIAAALSGSDSAAGVPTAANLVGRAAAAYPLGWLLDRAGRRLGLSFGYLIGVAAMFLSAWSVVVHSFVGFLLGAALLGACRAASEQGRYIAAEVFAFDRRAKIIGAIVFAGTLGAVGGPLLVDPSGALVARWGLERLAGPFVIGAITLLAAGALIFIFLRPDPL